MKPTPNMNELNKGITCTSFLFERKKFGKMNRDPSQPNIISEI